MWSVTLRDNSMWFPSRSCQFNNVVLINRWMIIFHWGWCCCWWTRCLIWRREISGCAETLKTSYSSSSKPRMETPSTGATDTRALSRTCCLFKAELVFLLHCRKIVDHVDYMTSPEQVSDFVKRFRWWFDAYWLFFACVILVCLLTGFFDPCRDSYWPNGILAETPPRRDKSVRMRTRVAAKTTLLGIMPGTHTHTHTHHSLNLITLNIQTFMCSHS